MKFSGRRKWVVIFVLFLIAVATSGSFFWWNWLASPRGGKDQVIFVIKRGENLDSIASRLEEKGIIRSSLSFKIYVLVNNLSAKIQAGNFRLNSAMSLAEIAHQLAHGRLDIWVTFLEGWRSEQMGEKLILEGFELNIENWKLKIGNSSLEGYLFPDTYLLPKNASPETIISLMKSNFEEKINLQLREEIRQKKLTLNEVITLASIVEREVKTPQDRAVVAGILIKRWRQGWLLQADATVQYALAGLKCQPANQLCDWWPKNLTIQDLKIDSSYNTYKYAGLPPGPICNPGLSSIKAVINWQETPYWFYLSDREGKIHYSQTLEEHNRKIFQYLGK